MAAPASLSLALVLASVALVSGSGKVRNVYWNTSTTSTMGGPITVTVNEGNLPWEYDQLNLICPRDSAEQHVIYSVDRQQFERCRVTGARPRIVAVCNQQARTAFMYFTITFRSFTPTPGGLEFRPGQEYFFISTASQRDIHRRVGGWCSSHNMRMVVKVAESAAETEHSRTSSTFSPIPSPAAFWSNLQHRSPGRTNKNLVPEHYHQSQGETYFSNDNPDKVMEFRDESVDISITGRSHNSAITSYSSFYLVLLMSLSWTLSVSSL